jgi:hypothetical protein
MEIVYAIVIFLIVGIQTTTLVVAYRNFKRLYDINLKMFDHMTQKNVLRKGLK